MRRVALRTQHDTLRNPLMGQKQPFRGFFMELQQEVTPLFGGWDAKVLQRKRTKEKGSHF